ncbi:MAG: hypothetical protein V1660_00860 [archaeon]
MLKEISRIIPLSMIDFFLLKILKNPVLTLNILKVISPDLLEDTSKRKALYQAKRTIKKVKLYKNFLIANKIEPGDLSLNDLKTLPYTSKEYYISKAKDISELLIEGDIKNANIIYKSSGYTGKPFIWANNLKEEESDIDYARLGLENLFQASKKNTLFINGFALGSWVSGMKFAYIMRSIGPTINTGANIQEILEIIKIMGNKFDQIVIGGYPPFVKNLLEGGIKNGINFKKYNINFLLAGEGFPESCRDYMYNLIGSSPQNSRSRIYSIYGAADIGVSGINENEDTVNIRRMAEKNKKLAKRLFGEINTLPMLFHYNSMNFFIESTDKKEVVMSKINRHSLQPLIKYNIHDLGGVISNKEMRKILKEEGIKLKIKLALPFFFVNGRSDGTISINAAKVYPDTVMKAMYNNHYLANITTGRFRLRKEYNKNNDTIFIVDIELKKYINPSIRVKRLFEKEIKTELIKSDIEYQDMINHYSDKALPHVNLLKLGELNSERTIKNVYLE